MNTRALLYTLLFVGVIIGGYFLFPYLAESKKSKLWDLVPENSVAVYERGNCTSCIDSLKNTTWFSVLKRTFLDNDSDDSATYKAYLEIAEKSNLISLHKTAKHEFEFVFFTHSSESMLFQEITVSKGWQSRVRSFSGITIHELVRKNKIFTWVDFNNYRAISTSAVLIEDVVRTAQIDNKKSFLNIVNSVASLPITKNDGGNILINLSAFSDWLGLFAKEANLFNSKVSGATILDVKVADQSIVLNGFSDPDTVEAGSILQVFKGQAPVAFNLRRQISNDANWVLSLGFSDPSLLGRKLQSSLTSLQRKSLQSRAGLDEETVTTLYKELGTEAVLQSVEMSAGRTSKLFLLDIKSSNEWINTLNRLTEEAKEDTVYAETYSNYLIKRINGAELLRITFPIIEWNEGDLYFSQMGNVLVFSADIDAIKKVISDIEQEDTWGKSLEKNRFLEATLLESNVSLYFDPDKSIRAINRDLSDNWQLFTTNSINLINALDLSAIQFSHLNDNFYTNIYLGLNALPIEKVRSVNVQNSLNLSEQSIHKIFVLKNHNDKNFEVAVQDSSQMLRLISAKGDVLWSKKLDGLIVDDMKQIDFFANGKLQMLFSTGKQLHIIDRLGNYVKPYPSDLSFQSKFMGVIDYDHSKKYRFVLSDKDGKIFMVDKQSSLLDGWKPLSADAGELLTSPRHFRVSGKDYIAVVYKKGVFNLYNRRGEIIKGFPVDIKGRLKQDFHLITKSVDNQPYFVFVTLDGFKVKIDLKGNEVEREALMKPSLETSFSLINEESGKSYLVVRQDNKGLSLLNEEGVEIASNNYVGLSNVKIKMFDFGSANVYYTIVDKDQELGYVYDASGRLLTSQPIQCNDLSVYLFKKDLSVISFYEKSLSIKQLK